MQLSSGRMENMRKKGTSTKTRAMANVEKYDDGDDVEEEIRHVKDVQIGKSREKKLCWHTAKHIDISRTHQKTYIWHPESRCLFMLLLFRSAPFGQIHNTIETMLCIASVRQRCVRVCLYLSNCLKCPEIHWPTDRTLIIILKLAIFVLSSLHNLIRLDLLLSLKQSANNCRTTQTFLRLCFFRALAHKYIIFRCFHSLHFTLMVCHFNVLLNTNQMEQKCRK